MGYRARQQRLEIVRQYKTMYGKVSSCLAASVDDVDKCTYVRALKPVSLRLEDV